MIYLTFDSNIWIYSLDESWKIENQLDYLEPWIQKGQVKLLLPEMIIREWNNHEKRQVKEREKKLGDFFQMAEEILPSAFFAEYKEPAVQRGIINEQLQRVRNLILQSETIPEYPEIKERVFYDGIAKKAPMHKKSSVADAVIVYSLIHFAKLHQGNHYFFISNNTEDFYQKMNGNRKEIHADLKSDFDNNNIQVLTTLNELIHRLQTSHNLETDENIVQIRKRRIRNKIKEKVYNPEYDRLTTGGKGAFIQNIDTVQYILNESQPTKEQVIFVLALIDSDASYEREFYRRLAKSSWFEILKRKGVYDPSNNPPPLETDRGIQMPFWDPLTFIEKLSEQIRDGRNLDLVDEILEIILNFSKNPIDNSTTWFKLIVILANLPAEKISLATLDFIPTWLKSRFDNMLQSSAICENLLPKFLSDTASEEDIKKAERIYHHVPIRLTAHL